MATRLHYDASLTPLAKALRTGSTLSEVLLWQCLKRRQVRGFQFLRQRPIGPYIVDFLCVRLRLVIEIDGESHADKEEPDAQREQYLRDLGYTVLRFDDRAVKQRRDAVVEAIHAWIEEQNAVSDGK